MENHQLVIIYGLVHIMGLPVSLGIQRELVRRRPLTVTALVLAGMSANMAFLTWVGAVWLTTVWIGASISISAALAWRSR